MEDVSMTQLRVAKQTFNPNTNYFDLEYVTITRELNEYEDQLWDKRDQCERRGIWSIGLGTLMGLICLITFGALLHLNTLFIFGIIFGILCVPGGIGLAHGYFFEREQKYATELYCYRQEHEEELWAEAMKEVKAYNEEQEHIAEAWRAAHPFEEHIRTCINDPNSSVAIAEAAKYYAENYLS
jgi:hypothetical protein